MSLLAEKLEELLTEAQRRFGVVLPEPVVTVGDNDPLDSPVDEEFRVGTLGLAFDVDTATVVIEAIATGEAEPEVELGEPDDAEDADDVDVEPDEDLDRLRVRLTPEATRQFIERPRGGQRRPAALPALRQPLDRRHLCPRHNGYHR